MRIGNLYIKPLYIILGLIGVFLFGLVSSYTILTLIQKPKTASKASSNFPILTPVGTPTPPKNDDGSYNVVLLGSGGAHHSGGNLTDSIIIVHGNPTNKTATLISIPRDLWVNGNYKINAGVTNVGAEGFKATLQNISGLKIDKYISIDFDSFVALIDKLGGIAVDVPRTFDDSFYPIRGEENNTCGFTDSQINNFKALYSGFNLEKQFTCRYEHLHFDAGPATLDGATALKFVRSRHGDSDFGRSLRQFAVLIGIEKKIISTNTLSNINVLYSSLINLVSTDLDLATANNLAKLFMHPDTYQINKVQLTTDNVLTETKSAAGAYILIPRTETFNYSGVQKFIMDNIDK